MAEQIEYPRQDGRTVTEQLQDLMRWAVEATEKLNYIMIKEEEDRGR